MRMLRSTAVAVLSLVSLISFSPAGRAGSVYGDITHASNAGATDRNLGRNFLHLGWAFDSGFMISAGSYFAGQAYCFKSATLAQRFGGGHWEVRLTGHEGGTCNLDSRSVQFERNYGLCVGRDLIARSRWQLALGGCVWRQADYTTGNLMHPDYPLSTIDEGRQLTAMILMRFHLWTRTTG